MSVLLFCEVSYYRILVITFSLKKYIFEKQNIIRKITSISVSRHIVSLFTLSAVFLIKLKLIDKFFHIYSFTKEACQEILAMSFVILEYILSHSELRLWITGIFQKLFSTSVSHRHQQTLFSLPQV